MAGFRLTFPAEQDFDGIGEYTLQTWGERQAENYLIELDAVFHLLVSTPALGKDRSELRPHLRSYPCNRHIIYFRRNATGDVEILRILHERMDVDRHL